MADFEDIKLNHVGNNRRNKIKIILNYSSQQLAS